jgi:hypothetical protein
VETWINFSNYSVKIITVNRKLILWLNYLVGSNLIKESIQIQNNFWIENKNKILLFITGERPMAFTSGEARPAL